MSKVITDVSMSLDGFVAGPAVSVEAPMGEGGEKLRMFDVGVGTWEDTPYPAPCFVITHEEREDIAMKSGTFTFAADGIESALRQAKATAGEKDVIVMGGADIIRQFLEAGLVDEMSIHLVPVLLGDGIRLFDRAGKERIELENTRVVESPKAAHFVYRIKKED
ncbi:MAG: dihydrofolate reductase family protein [Rubrobacteraceae bacterium]